MTGEAPYPVFRWIDEDLFSVQRLKLVDVPRKSWEDYQVGEMVLSKCQGFPGVHKGELMAIGNSKCFLNQCVT